MREFLELNETANASAGDFHFQVNETQKNQPKTRNDAPDSLFSTETAPDSLFGVVRKKAHRVVYSHNQDGVLFRLPGAVRRPGAEIDNLGQFSFHFIFHQMHGFCNSTRATVR